MFSTFTRLFLPLVILESVGIFSAFCAEEKGQISKRCPLVVMKQAEIRGKVFLLSEKDDEEMQAIPKMKIQVYTSEGKKLVYKTSTDKEGNYSLPNLEVGQYRMMVGLLELVLRVEDPVKNPSKSRLIPKTIAVFIPKELEDFQAE